MMIPDILKGKTRLHELKSRTDKTVNAGEMIMREEGLRERKKPDKDRRRYRTTGACVKNGFNRNHR